MFPRSWSFPVDQRLQFRAFLTTVLFLPRSIPPLPFQLRLLLLCLRHRRRERALRPPMFLLCLRLSRESLNRNNVFAHQFAVGFGLTSKPAFFAHELILICGGGRERPLDFKVLAEHDQIPTKSEFNLSDL